MEGSDPRGTEARFGRGAVRVFTRSSPPPAGVAPLELSLREGSQRRCDAAGKRTARPELFGLTSLLTQPLIGRPFRACMSHCTS